MDWEPVIGLEVHVQLKTRTKIFCRCANAFGGEPNSRVCPVCLGYPGTLPVLNGEAVDKATRVALALGCEVRARSVFARKNYFYADLPKGYQISQFEEPLAEWGSLPLSSRDRTITIRRLHMEEDAGKLLHETPGGGALPGQSLVDFNRCGVPLVEIVTEPDVRSSAEAQDYLQVLHQVLRYTDASDGNMEEGSLRCDANVSLRPRGESRLGTKVEVKNMNSFRHVARALDHEIERQASVLEAGGEVAQETRSFEAGSGTTRSLRGKEEAHDYRYFPDPDLRPILLEQDRIEALQQSVPELPWHRLQRFQDDYGLTLADASVLVSAREVADYFEAVVDQQVSAKAAANWVMTEVLRELKADPAFEQAMPAPRLARLIALVEQGEVSNTAAKEVFGAIRQSSEEPEEAVERLGLRQVSDRSALEQWVREVTQELPGPVAQARAGEEKVLGFLVGQVMRKSSGRADPSAARSLLKDLLQESPLQAPAVKP